MTQTDERATTIKRWLSANWHGKARCPAGHDDRWHVEDTMSFMPGLVTEETGPRIAHERGFRFVVLTCEKCGYVALLNARTLGIDA